MKILKITDIGYESGGVENGIVLMQPFFAKRGVQIKTLASADRPDLPHFNNYSYRRFSRFEKPFYTFNPFSYFGLKGALADFKPDVVHIHTIGQASPSIFYLLKDYPTVLTVHGPEEFSQNLLLWCFPKSSFKNGTRSLGELNFMGNLRYFYHHHINSPLYQTGFKNVNQIVTLSLYMHNLMDTEGLVNSYIPNGIELFNYHPVDKITHNLLYVGRLENYKGVDYLIESLPQILSQYPDTKLSIVGDGGAKQRLEKLAQNFNLQNQIKFLGQANRNNLDLLYQAASIVVIPSVYPEAFGKVGIEAMSVGRPVVGTDVGGIPEWLIDGQNGYLVPPANSLALAQGILKLWSNPNQYQLLAQNARKKAEEYDIQKHVDNMIAIYNHYV
jgi:glycosyltransferase involved in cell wall biosynthesis